MAVSVERMRAAYDALACGVILQDRGGMVVYANAAAQRDRLEHDLLGASLGFERLAADGSRLPATETPMAIAIRTKSKRSGVIGIKRDDGSTRWWMVEAVPLLDGAGEIAEVVASVVDVTAQREAERTMREQSLRDALTQLPNRALFLDRLATAIAAATRDRTPLALLLMDLDHFKEVNDTFGHQTGDELLRQVASRLSSAIRRSDSLGRLGGDEFAFVLPGANEAGAETVARTILASLEPSFTVEDQALELGGSIGISLFPRHGEDADSLLRRADIAMYTAKRTGGGVATYDFEDELDADGPHRLTLVAELRHAIETNEIALLYQPIFTFDKGLGTRAEALARWRHPSRGLVLPGEFIGAAERSGLIRGLFENVVRTALKECATWRAAGRDVRLAVNMSARNLVDPTTADVVARALDEAGLTAAWLGLEITETMLMADPERSLRTLTRLQHMGLHLAIDDFGVGYSSLAYLQRLPVYAVKIDRSFVNDMRHDLSSQTIVEATIDLAHRLGLKACAEGVEDQETFQMLAAMGCDSVQGYYIGRPMTASKLADWSERLHDDRIVDLAGMRAQRARPVSSNAIANTELASS